MFNVFHEVRPTGERAGRRPITPFIFIFPQPAFVMIGQAW